MFQNGAVLGTRPIWRLLHHGCSPPPSSFSSSPSQFGRPIYFLELRNGYACGWCEMQKNTLLLLPHPLSPCSVRQFVYEVDAEIVGQVTGVAMRIVDLSPRAESGNAKALKPQ